MPAHASLARLGRGKVARWVGGLAAVALLTGGQTALAGLAAAEEAPAAETASYIVTFKSGVSADEQADALADAGAAEVSAVPQLRLRSVTAQAAGADALRTDGRVARVDDDAVRAVEGASNDAHYADQWSLPKISWDAARESASPAGSAIVAVLDTGVDASHPDLAANTLPGTSVLDGSDGRTDPNGHGTAMAGIVAAEVDNGEGIAGVGYAGVKVLPVTVLGADGTGQDSDIISGVVYAVDKGADVILMSFSSPGYSGALQAAVDYAWDNGAVLVAAAGNDGTSTPVFPAGDRGVVGVSNTTQDDSLHSSSSTGEAVFLGAPGTGIVTTGGGGVTSLTGTSASAAVVAGSAAVLAANDAAASNGVIVGRLARNADAAGTAAETGNGRVNLARALEDNSTQAVVPGPSGELGDGGPFVGPYVVAAFGAKLEGKSSDGNGNPTGPWIANNLKNWKATETIPLRVSLTGGPATNQLVSIEMPQEKLQGSTVLPAFLDLRAFAAGTGVAISPTSPTPVDNGDSLTYSFRVTMSSSVGEVTLTTSMRPGAHTFTGSALSLTGSPSLGTLQVSKPDVAPGRPDLTVVKTGLSTVSPGSTVTYSLNYSNKITAANAATTVAMTDSLPPGFTYVEGSCGVCTVAGQDVTWNLGTLAPGASDTRTLQAVVPSGAAFNSSHTNTALILSAENDADPGDNTSSVTSTVSFNRAPVAVTDAYSVDEDAVLNPTTSVLANDTDADGNALTAVRVSGPANGSLTLNSNGTFSYTPNANFNGTDSFSYKAHDGSADSNSVAVTITVRPVNDAPTASAGTLSVLAGSSANALTLVGSDLETAATNLTYMITSAPANGTLSTGTGASRTYTPNAGFSGTDSFTITVTDRGDPDNCDPVSPSVCAAALTSGAAIVTITVTARGTTTEVAPATATYGDSVAALSAAVTSASGTPNAGTVTFTVSSGGTTIGTATAGNVVDGVASASYPIPTTTGAGSYTVSAVYGGGSGFSGSSASGTLTVARAVLTIAAANAERLYGATNPTFTGTTGGIMNGDAVTASYSTPAVAGSNAGTYAIVPTAVGTAATLANYTVQPTNGTLTINKAPLTVTADDKNRGYGATNPSFSVSYSGFVLGQTASALGGTLSVTTTAGSSTPVGSYAITPSGQTSDNYEITFANGVLSVTPAALSVSSASDSRAYGQPNPSLTGAIVGLKNGDAITATYSTTAVATSPVGGYPITATLADPDGKLGNYTVTRNEGTLTVTQASLVVTPSAASRDYGDANPTFTGAVIGVVNGDGITATYATAATPASPVGNYDITATLVDPNSKAGNYAVTLNTSTLTVDPAALSVVVDNKTRTYGAAEPTLTGTLTGVKNSDPITVAYSTAATQASPVGEHTITATLADPSNKLGNYTVTNTPGTLTITPAPMTVTADDKTKVYGNANPAFTVRYDGFVNSDGPSSIGGTAAYAVSADEASGIGTYPITPSGLTSSNYTIRYEPGTLTVTQATLTITAAPASKTYGDVNPSFSGTIEGLKNGDSITATYSTTATETSGVGTYDIVPAAVDSTPAKLANYSLSLEKGMLTIGRAPLAVTAHDKSTVYGAALPTLTGTLTGVKSWDTVTALYSTTALQSSSVASYPITAALTAALGVLGNYDVTNTPGVLTVTPAPLTVTAVDSTKVYGDANPGFAVTYRGFVNGDAAASLTGTPAFSTIAGPTSGVGTYPVTPSAVGSSNYSIAFVAGTMTVTPAPLTITADNNDRVYGNANPPLTGTIDGVQNGDAVGASYSTVAGLTSPVGDHTIVSAATGTAAALANYTVTLHNGTLTVTKAPLMITASNASKTYGAPVPSLSGTLTGLKNGDGITATYTTTATSASNVGSYAVVPTAVDASPSKLGNYDLTLTHGTLTVTPEPLTVTADNRSAQYSDPLVGGLTATYSGFVLGQDDSALGGTLVLSTIRTLLSPAGSYPISVSGLTSTNYEINFVNGTFTVSKEDVALTYTGDSLVSTGSTNSNSTTSVRVSALLVEEADGNLGSHLGGRTVVFTATNNNGVVRGTCPGTLAVPGTYTGTGTAGCTINNLGEGPYTIDMKLDDNLYYDDDVTPGAVTVALAGTGFTTGGGWLTEPNFKTRSNLGFNAKFLKSGGVQGNSLYIYRRSVAADEVRNPAGGFLPAGQYNWIVKSNAMSALRQSCPTRGSHIGCTASFSGKSTITAVNRTTDVGYGLGGNNQFQVDVTDNGEPGSSSATNPDTYTLRVWDGSGTSYQLGTPLSQIALNGGNIQVRP